VNDFFLLQSFSQKIRQAPVCCRHSQPPPPGGRMREASLPARPPRSRRICAAPASSPTAQRISPRASREREWGGGAGSYRLPRTRGGGHYAVRIFPHNTAYFRIIAFSRIFPRNLRIFPPFLAKSHIFFLDLENYSVRIFPHDSAYLSIITFFSAQFRIFWHFFRIISAYFSSSKLLQTFSPAIPSRLRN